MNISQFSIRRPVTTMMIILSMTILGTFVFFNLKTQLMPNVSSPYISITTRWNGASPDNMETLVTKKLEQTLSGIEGIKSVRTFSRSGSSSIRLEFGYSINIDNKMNEIITVVNSARGELPSETNDPVIRRSGMNNETIMMMTLSGEDLVALKIFADNIMLPRLEKISGVGSVDSSGGAKRRISIYIDPNKLEAFGIGITNIYSMLKNANINFPAGTIVEGDKKYLVRFFGELKTFEDIQNIVLRNKDGKTLFLHDIAEIKLDAEEKNSFGRTNGIDNILISIDKTETGNTIEISDEVKKQLETFAPILPQGSELIISRDTAKDIKNSISSVRNNAVIGLVLAALVLFIFLKNIRTTLIVAIAIPVSIVASFGLFGAKGMTLNIVSLMGISLGIGMLVDNSIVVLDNIFRHLTELGEDKIIAAERGATEVIIPVVTSTATTISVFLPVVMKDGMLKRSFEDMSFSITFSLIASLIVALTFVPMVCSRILEHNNNNKSKTYHDGKILIWIRKKYERILILALNFRLIIIGLVLILFAVVVLYGSKFTGGQLQPTTDNGLYSVVAALPSGLDIEKANRISRRLEKIVQKNKDTKKFTTRVNSDSVSVIVDIGLLEDRKNKIPIADIISDMRKSIGKIPDVTLNVRQGMRFGRGAQQDFEMSVKSVDSKQLEYVTRNISSEMKKISGFEDVTNSLVSGVAEARLIADRKKLEYLGINPETLAREISYQILGGSPIKIKTDKEEIAVTILLEKKYQKSLDLLMESRVKSSGGMLKLRDVLTLEIAEGPTEINKLDKIISASISANFSGDFDLVSAQEKIQNIIHKIGLPDSVTYSFEGDSKRFRELQGQSYLIFGISLFLIYFILAAQFESYFLPLIVMGTVPFSIIGVYAGLLLTKQKVDMMVYIGFIMLAGIVVNNAIILIDFIQELLAQEKSLREALVESCKIRLRPILMTTITTLFGMFPMAFGLGQGSEMYKGLAITVISGLSFSTLLTLFVVPVLFNFYYNVRAKFFYL
ncbi:MAG: efflux RND transporter permease subunit [Fusobacteriaceae bacterium]